VDEFCQSAQDPGPEAEHSCGTGGGRYVFLDLAVEVLGCIGVGPKGVSGEGGVECIGVGIRRIKFQFRLKIVLCS